MRTIKLRYDIGDEVWICEKKQIRKVTIVMIEVSLMKGNTIFKFYEERNGQREVIPHLLYPSKKELLAAMEKRKNRRKGKR